MFFFLEGNKISEIVYVEQIYYWHTQMIRSNWSTNQMSVFEVKK